MNHTIIVNLTSFPIAEDLKSAGVQAVHPANFPHLKEAVQFSELPTLEEIKKRAKRLRTIAAQSIDYYILSLQPVSEEIKSAQEFLTEGPSHLVREKLKCAAMISAPPWLEYYLIPELKAAGITPVFNFTKMEEIEGRRKFTHMGFVAL